MDRSPAQRLPKTFRSPAFLRVLNVVSVGASLGAATGVVLGSVFGGGFLGPVPAYDSHLPRFEGRVAAASAISTLLVGVLWAIVLRSRTTIGKSPVRVGWVVSIPLAIANAATACGSIFALERSSMDSSMTAFFQGAFAGATFGAICWLPALVATLLCFGVPIAWSQRLATKGLAGEERGELVVGGVSTVIAVGAAALLYGHDFGTPPASLGAVIVALLASIGGGAGLVASLLSLRRENERRSFVREVEAGGVSGYRVDATDEGKVLVRITSMGQSYRVADFEEPVFELDATGEAQRSLELGR